MHSRLRILTYNVHRCIGRDKQLSPGRVADAIAELEPDVVALQELDVGCARTGYVDQAAVIAKALGMSALFHAVCKTGSQHYGQALLSRLPMQQVRAGILPTLPERPGLEPRGALWATLQHGDVNLQVVTTHLGLRNRERILQAEALAGPDWLGHSSCKSPLIVCGDFNAVPGTRAYRRLRSMLRNPFSLRTWPIGTFPSGLPLLRLDHILLSPTWIVHHASVPRTRFTRVASDHLPVLAEISVPGNNGAVPLEQLADALAL